MCTSEDTDIRPREEEAPKKEPSDLMTMRELYEEDMYEPT